MMKTYTIIEFPHFSDSRGETVPFEFDDRMPFRVKRAYVFTGTKGKRRGGHAHRTEQEVFICLVGSVTIRLHDGGEATEIHLSQKNKGVYVPPYCWHELCDFSEEALVLALSSTHYNGRSDYIEDKEAFLKKNYKNHSKETGLEY